MARLMISRTVPRTHVVRHARWAALETRGAPPAPWFDACGAHRGVEWERSWVEPRVGPVVVAVRAGAGAAPEVRRRVVRVVQRATKRMEPHARGVLTVTLVGERDMARVHEDALGEAGPTDIVSWQAEMDSGVLGEVFLCVPFLVKSFARASNRSKSLDAVAKRAEELVTHGLAHVCGETHYDAGAFLRMRAAETRMLGRPCLSFENWPR